MKSVLWIIFVALALTLSACEEKQVGENQVGDNENGSAKQDNNEQEQIQGYIVFVKENDMTILIRDEDFNIEDIHLSLKELQGKYKDIMLLNIKDRPNDIKSGQKVKIGASRIQESNPPRVDVTEIEIIKNSLIEC